MSCFLLVLCLPSQNFSADDARFVSAAEAARWRSALFWTDRPLPGNWSRACPITIQLRETSSGGATRFLFDRGEVSGWSMTLVGRRNSILADALPHEVDHMVRASLIRRPILRCLDEGAAGLFESREEHARLRSRARAFALSDREPAFLFAREYPRRGEEVADLYAVGFSLTEYLLNHGTRSQLLELQASNGGLEASMQRIYGRSLPQQIAGWRAETVALKGASCEDAGCPIHRPAIHSAACRHQTCAAANVLNVWSASWCVACRQFWTDYRTDPRFRTAVDARVHLHHVDADRYAAKARAMQIRVLPTFMAGNQRIEGYLGKGELLADLERLFPDRSEPPIDDENASVADSEVGANSTSDDAVIEEPPVETLPVADGEQVTLPAAGASDPLRRPPESLPASCEPADHRRLFSIAGLTLSALEWFGLAGATTGPLGLALALFTFWRRRKPHELSQKRRSGEGPSGTSPSVQDRHGAHAPFPRELDEARELLRLRQREGRVAALDAIRGMVVDDELDHLADTGHRDVAEQLRRRLNERVQQIAPIASSEEQTSLKE